MDLIQLVFIGLVGWALYKRIHEKIKKDDNLKLAEDIGVVNESKEA